MSNVYFTSDTHLGHKGVERFRKCVTSCEDNTNLIVTSWNKLVSKRDVVYVLGDAAFTQDGLDILKGLPGKKYLVRGNHDTFKTREYLGVFEEVYGLLKYKDYWLSHSPIHPNELRNKISLHGHVHYATVQDNRYINCCVENVYEKTGEALISLDQLREGVLNED